MSSSTQFETDTIPTSAGDLEITFLGHGTLMMTFGGRTIHVDPYSGVADYANLPKADIVLITHEHGDHLDETALSRIRTPNTTVVLTQLCAQQVSGGVVMRNGDSRTVKGLPIEAVPAYNIAHERPDGQPFHPKGAGSGYIITFGDVRVYIGADTENIPEMEQLQDIDVAFLPMNLPYTMAPEMVAEAARVIRPRILYPYHSGGTNTSELVDLLADDQGIEVRIRRLA